MTVVRRIGALARHAVLFEVAIYVALWRWVARRPAVPPSATPIPYSRIAAPVLWLFIWGSAIEVVAVDLVVHHFGWTTVRIPLLAVGIWSVVWMVGLLAAMRTRPHVLTPTDLRLRAGLRAELVLPLAAVDGVTTRRQSSPAPSRATRSSTTRFSSASVAGPTCSSRSADPPPCSLPRARSRSSGWGCGWTNRAPSPPSCARPSASPENDRCRGHGILDHELRILGSAAIAANRRQIRLTNLTPSRDVQGMTWRIELGPDQRREDETAERLVEHNQEASVAVRRRFEPDNLPARPVAAYAVDDAGGLFGGCVGSTVDVWQWLTVDMMWVRPSHRGQGTRSSTPRGGRGASPRARLPLGQAQHVGVPGAGLLRSMRLRHLRA